MTSLSPMTILSCKKVFDRTQLSSVTSRCWSHLCHALATKDWEKQYSPCVLNTDHSHVRNTCPCDQPLFLASRTKHQTLRVTTTIRDGLPKFKAWQGLNVYILRAVTPGIDLSTLWPICRWGMQNADQQSQYCTVHWQKHAWPQTGLCMLCIEVRHLADDL